MLDTDCGIGVIERGESETIEIDASVAEMTYEDLAADRARLLGLGTDPLRCSGAGRVGLVSG